MHPMQMTIHVIIITRSIKAPTATPMMSGRSSSDGVDPAVFKINYIALL